VAQDPQACRILASWQDHFQAEIGAHLHPWNTPPFQDLPHQEPVPSEQLPLDLLRAKLATLLGSLKQTLGASPRSFRMGRFDAGAQIFSLLPEFGILVDSSMVPLRQSIGGPDHFLTPAEPFFLQAPASTATGLLEAPLTLLPVWPRLARWVHHFSTYFQKTTAEKWRRAFARLGAVGIQPTMFPLASMRTAVYLHRRRRGRTLVLYLHSSELLPGASPQFPTEASISRLVRKIRRFLEWLQRNVPLNGVTLSQLYALGGWQEKGT
jgi:hypothetical protein